ncbi:MAG: hypothetical protein RL091_2018 [Verrucomicrobiota bacterium]|jgi:hypothetical protein
MGLPPDAEIANPTSPELLPAPGGLGPGEIVSVNRVGGLK